MKLSILERYTWSVLSETDEVTSNFDNIVENAKDTGILFKPPPPRVATVMLPRSTPLCSYGIRRLGNPWVTCTTQVQNDIVKVVDWPSACMGL